MAKGMTPENIGSALGQLANRVDAWKKQRDQLISEGERLAALAAGYLQELRGDGAATKTGRKRAAKGKGGRPRGMKMSEETKAKLRAAWKRRKARMASTATEKKRARG